MGTRPNRSGVDEYALRLVRAKARSLVGKYGFTWQDVDDIAQDLLLDLVERMDAYDKAKSRLGTFITRVVNHRVANIVEARKASKRGLGQTMVSLDAPITGKSGEAGRSRHELIDEETYLQRTRPSGRSAAERLDLRIDLNAILGSLPEDLRTLCIRLQFESITDLAQSIGVPKSTLYERIRCIRELLEVAGLDDYLRHGPTFSRRFR